MNHVFQKKHGARCPSWRLAIMAILGLFMAAPLFARSPYPMIEGRSLGKRLADEVEQLVEHHRGDLETAQREVAGTLSRGMSARGVAFQRNFPNGIHLDPRRSDVLRVITNVLRGNSKNRGGYVRELKYINMASMEASPFRLVSVGDRARISDGRLVEYDLRLRHKWLRRDVVIEVKDWSIRSARDLDEAKSQIAKIAKRAAEDGVDEVLWVNRQTVRGGHRDALRMHAAEHGVDLYDDVSTSTRRSRIAGKVTRFDDLLHKVSMRQWGRFASKAAGRVGGILVVTELIAMGMNMKKWRTGGISQREAWVNLGGHIGSVFGAIIFLVPAPWAGLVVGWFLGDYVGRWLAGLICDRILFEDLDEKERYALQSRLSEHYSRSFSH